MSDGDEAPLVVVSETYDGPEVEGLIFEDVPADQVPEPTFSVSQVAETFFARTSYWLRWRESKDGFVFDGKPVVPMRTEGGARVYRLPDIERMAHGLAQQHLIGGEELVKIIRVIYAVADLWGYIKHPEPEPEDHE